MHLFINHYAEMKMDTSCRRYTQTQLGTSYQGLSAWSIAKEEVEAALRTLAENRRWG